MRIIRKANNKKEEFEFTCKNCGCEFACEKDEYWTDSGITSVSYPPSFTIYSSCPNCHKICTSYKKIAIDSHKITLTGDMMEGLL